ncbi:DUF1986 domain-containing protein [Sorangium sp. So ce861]|uniref:serine protease n=1 Tax=Sorangium sp. So ce861 TaxID=3133323 RepID=UPI003F61DBCB
MSERCLVVALMSFTLIGCSAESLDLEELDQTVEAQQEIVGGSAAYAGQAPWQARLTRNGAHWCGGSLIRKRWILTAAHCVSGQSAASLRVILGDRRTDQLDEGEHTHQIRQLIVHPSYNASTNANDVALIELSTDAALNSFVQTIALQRTQASYASHGVSGWGQTAGGNLPSSTTLMVATLPVVASASCEAAFGVGLFASEICAGFYNGSQGACSGDSGGPLVTQTTPIELAGVVSWGSQACNTYSVFARVSSFVGWVDSHVNRDFNPGHWTTQYSDAGGWSMAESHWGTIEHPDLNGDGKQDVCGRSGLGLLCALSNGSAFNPPSLWTTAYRDADYWGWSESNWGTIKYPDLNGDGKQDVCGRSGLGLACALSNGTSFSAPTSWTTGYSDSGGWSMAESHWGTIEYPDLNGDGKQDVCGRSGLGLACALSNGTSFNTPSSWTTQYSDSGGWSMAESHWGTIEYPDLNGDGKQDVCGRSGLGLLCALSNGASFNTPSLWTTAYRDADYWGWSESNWGTIKYPDLNGDGKQDVCGRSGLGLACALSNGTSFNAPTSWTTGYSDSGGWSMAESHWRTIEYPDLNGDGKQDVCGRSGLGLACALSNGTSFNTPSSWTTQYSDSGGWGTAEHHWGTLRYPDLDGDGKQDVCGRSASGLYCAR